MCCAGAGALLKADTLRAETSSGRLSAKKSDDLTIYGCMCRCLFDMAMLVHRYEQEKEC